MKKLTVLFTIVLCAFIMTSCNKKKKDLSGNPFFTEYTTPFGVPPFDKIDTTHYIPAFEEGMIQHNLEIDSIINSKEEPTFENTILKYDKSGRLLTKVGNVFFNLLSALTNDRMQDIAMEISPKLSEHRDAIMMNEKLFARIKAIYDKRNESKLDSQQIRVVEKYYKDFVRNGANLSKDKQDSLKSVNSKLSKLELQFGQNLLAETKDFKLIVDKKEDLEGLPQTSIDAAAEAAKEAGKEGKWIFTLDKPSLIPFLQYAKNRELREKIYRGYFMRGDNDNKNDNKKIIDEIVNLRIEKAKLLGYTNFAQYVIEQNMAKTPETVNDFLIKLWTPALKVSKNELVDMQKIIDKEKGNFKLASWDWWYYAEKVRKEKYNLEETELQPYLSLSNVRDGMFYVANKLYGITFDKKTDIPVYQSEVEVFEVKEADGKHLGLLYLDYYPRVSKDGGAWCTSFREAGWDFGKKVDPIVSIVCNFTKPSGDAPALLTWDEATTLFHEFGHGLHSLFTDGKYNRTAGSVPRDYVELPSQIMENWAGEKEVLKQYAKHYKTGEVIPDALIEKLNKSSKFNQGFGTVEYLAASILDLNYHMVNEKTTIDAREFEKTALSKIGLIPEILPRYRSTYFSHIFSGGYSAGYYVYIWAEVLDSDAFDAFKKSGDLFNQDLATKFRKYCLQECGNDEGMTQYKKFRGQEPSIEPLLVKRGLK
ncbi:MAG TPA: M3 family metallopeptidase [Bacteroidales bacterium]|nr:M3 family metallopeptidase [Bacteroidales bacterium]